MELLPAIEMDSPNGAAVNASIIWLHGLGADGRELKDRDSICLQVSVCASFSPMRLLSRYLSTMAS